MSADTQVPDGDRDAERVGWLNAEDAWLVYRDSKTRYVEKADFIAGYLTALASQPAQSGDGVVIGREDLRAMAIELGRHAARWRNPRATSQLMNRVFIAITGQQPTTTEETNE